LLRDGDGVSLGHFNEAITHKPPCDVNAGEDWAKQAMRKLADNVVGGIPSMLRQSFKQVLADSKSQLSTQEASRLQAWLPKTQDGDIDWAAAAEWCAPPPPPPPPPNIANTPACKHGLGWTMWQGFKSHKFCIITTNV